MRRNTGQHLGWDTAAKSMDLFVQMMHLLTSPSPCDMDLFVQEAYIISPVNFWVGFRRPGGVLTIRSYKEAILDATCEETYQF
jgi:hypothetical protein